MRSKIVKIFIAEILEPEGMSEEEFTMLYLDRVNGVHTIELLFDYYGSSIIHAMDYTKKRLLLGKTRYKRILKRFNTRFDIFNNRNELRELLNENSDFMRKTRAGDIRLNSTKVVKRAGKLTRDAFTPI